MRSRPLQPGMGKRGPQPKPKWYTDIVGNPGKRNRDEVMPAIPVEVIEAPRHFSPAHLELWDKLCKILGSVGGLTERDQLALARYVDFNVIYAKAREFLDRSADGKLEYPIKQTVREVGADGKVTTREVVKSIRMLPQLRAMLEVSNHLLRIEQHFGLTPSSRIGPAGSGDGGDSAPFDPFGE